MPVPKKHKTHGRTRSRRSHLALRAVQFTACSHCGAATLPHVVCAHCGYYKDKEVINTLARTEKKAKRRQKKLGEAKKEPEEKKSTTLEELSQKQ